MSKKMLKRSLALGALMAFVITGSAMAAELKAGEFGTAEAFKTANGLAALSGGSSYCNFYIQSDSANELVTTGDIIYKSTEYGGNFGLFAGLSSNKATDQHLANPNGNILDIKHDLKVDTSGTVYLFGGVIDTGADAKYGSAAKGNSVYIGDGKTKITVKAGNHIFIGGAMSNDDAKANVIGNKVVVNNVKFELSENIFAIISGAEARSGSAEENTVEILNTTIENASILGGFVWNEPGSAISNNVKLNNVILGGSSECAGGYVQGVKGNANDNTVNIEGNSQIAGIVYGGYADDGTANNNTVIIKDGEISNRVYGGYSKVGTADNNTVNISGTADITNASLFGSNKVDGTGNTLNIKGGWTGEAKSFNNFNEINIEEAQWGTAVAEVESLALNDTKVNVGTVHVAGDDTTFVANGSSVLIKSGDTTGDVSSDSSVSVFKGVATIYDASVVKDGNDIKIQLGEDAASNPVYNPQVVVIGESRAAATAFTNQGSELVETGLDALARDKAEDTKVFASVYGNTSEFATGSEVKVNGWSGIVGIGKTNANGLTVGAFFENGEGNYRTYNDVNGEFMRGDGEACYNGGGLIVRKDNANGVYAEASLRAGNLQNELRNAVRGSEGLTGYDIDTFYYGAHVGIGKVIARGTEGDSIDVYGKFIYTHHDSEDFTIDGDEFHFDSVDSERLRLGFRINEVQNAKFAMYYGAAWEYEFNGDSNNTVVGYDLSTPSLGGSTVIGELGMHYKANEKWSFDLNGRAYTGQRDGFSGSVQANYMF